MNTILKLYVAAAAGALIVGVMVEFGWELVSRHRWLRTLHRSRP